MKKRVLVLGSSGYFGSVLVARLLEQGYTCRGFDLNPDPDLLPGVDFIQGDIRDLEAVRRACQDIDIVHHNVAQVPLKKRDRDLMVSTHIQGTENVLRAAQEKKLQKVIYTSSSAVFGIPKSNPVTEATVPTPLEVYGRSKYEAEKLCERYAAQGVDVTIMRPRTLLGHGRLGIFSILFEWVRQGQPLPVLGKGDNRYQFVHAEDFAQACILASEKPGASLYHCGTDRFGTMRDTLEVLCRHAKTGSKVVGLPYKLAEAGLTLATRWGLSPLAPYHSLMYGRSLYFDIHKAEAELNWHPQYSNEDMIIESYEWYLHHRDPLNADPQTNSPHRSVLKQGLLKIVPWILRL